MVLVFRLKVEIITIVQGSNACAAGTTQQQPFITYSVRTNYRTMTDKIVSEHETIAKKQNS